jgi:hypothetical protein
MGHPKPIRELVNKTGTLTASGLFNFDVFFDLLELPDPTDGVEGKLHTYGRLTFPQKLEPVLEKVLLSASRLTLKGGGIEVSIFLHGCNSFGVVGPIKDVSEEAA